MTRWSFPCRLPCPPSFLCAVNCPTKSQEVGSLRRLRTERFRGWLLIERSPVWTAASEFYSVCKCALARDFKFFSVSATDEKLMETRLEFLVTLRVRERDPERLGWWRGLCPPSKRTGQPPHARLPVPCGAHLCPSRFPRRNFSLRIWKHERPCL